MRFEGDDSKIRVYVHITNLKDWDLSGINLKLEPMCKSRISCAMSLSYVDASRTIFKWSFTNLQLTYMGHVYLMKMSIFTQFNPLISLSHRHFQKFSSIWVININLWTLNERILLSLTLNFIHMEKSNTRSDNSVS